MQCSELYMQLLWDIVDTSNYAGIKTKLFLYEFFFVWRTASQPALHSPLARTNSRTLQTCGSRFIQTCLNQNWHLKYSQNHISIPTVLFYTLNSKFISIFNWFCLFGLSGTHLFSQIAWSDLQLLFIDAELIYGRQNQLSSANQLLPIPRVISVQWDSMPCYIWKPWQPRVVVEWDKEAQTEFGYLTLFPKSHQRQSTLLVRKGAVLCLSRFAINSSFLWIILAVNRRRR